MGVREWLLGNFHPEPTQRKTYRELDGADTLQDIGDLSLDYFWQKCEQLLPEDWMFALVAYPDRKHPGRLLYRAQAQLVDSDMDPVPGIIPDPRSTPLRALEHLFYGLREL